ncbi:MAG TPA: protein phosphatase 2C domain-containing protein [Longimicrobiaceae bacterium]
MSALATGYATDRGRRPSNQDAVVATVLPDGREVVAVADGMGGHAAGEVASTTALQALLDALGGGAGLEDAYRAADRAIRDAAERDRSLDGMGTTLVALLRSGGRYWIANVGDSRAYRVSPEGIDRVTHDHSFAEEAVRSGQMTEEEVARSPWKNALTRALGTGDGQVEADVFGPFAEDAPHAVLLCSDGLHGVVEEEEIRACVVASGDSAAAAERLSALALRGGSRDNVTAAVRDFGLLLGAEAGEPAPPASVGPPPPAAAPAPADAAAPVPAPAPLAETAADATRSARAAPPPAPRPRKRHRRRFPLAGEGLLFAACCAALVVWLAYFLASL